MNVKQVDEIRENYRERALYTTNPDRKIREIWNTAVDIMACHSLFKYNPIKNAKYAIRMKRKMRKLEELMEGIEV